MNNKISVIFPVLLLVGFKALAQDYEDEDSIDPQASFYMILTGLALLGVGTIISQVKLVQGFGKAISFIGLFIGGFGLLGIALILLQWAIKTAITLALFIGGVVLAGYVIYHIYLAIFGPKKK